MSISFLNELNQFKGDTGLSILRDLPCTLFEILKSSVKIFWISMLSSLPIIQHWK